MLDDFLEANRAEIVKRCRDRVRARRAPRPTEEELEQGIPLFLDQLVDTLRRQRSSNPASPGSATRHGGDLLKYGFTLAQVVHDYGDVCQSVMGLAVERDEQVTAAEFQILNRSLDDAIADAVTEFSRVREARLAKAGTERLGVLAHEMRNRLATASLAFDALRSGALGMAGATAGVLERNLKALASLVDQSLADVRLEAGHLQPQRLDLRHLVEEVEIGAALAARPRGILLSVQLPVGGIELAGDPQILSAVLLNLLQNAMKFTPRGGHVGLETRVLPETLEIDVSDECGGLPSDGDTTEKLFRPFEQHGADRSGLGLGLTIARRGVEAHGGTIRVQDRPGAGCTFTVSLPRVAS